MSLVFLLVPLHLEQCMFKYFVLLKLLHLLIGWNSYYIMLMWLQCPPWLVQARNIDWSDTRNMRGTMASILPNHKRTSTWVQRIGFIYDSTLAGSSTAPASNLLLLELLLRTESILSLATSTSSWLCNRHHLVSTTKSHGLSSCEWEWLWPSTTNDPPPLPLTSCTRWAYTYSNSQSSKLCKKTWNISSVQAIKVYN